MIPMLINKNKLIFNSCQIIYPFWESKNMYAFLLQQCFRSSDSQTMVHRALTSGSYLVYRSVQLLQCSLVKAGQKKPRKICKAVLVVTQVNPLNNLGNLYFKFTHIVQVGTCKTNRSITKDENLEHRKQIGK